MQLRKTALAALAAAVAQLAIAATPLQAEEKSMDRTVTVSASGEVMAEPDQAHISTGVLSEAPTAREALTKNTEAMKKVVVEPSPWHPRITFRTTDCLFEGDKVKGGRIAG